MAQRCVAIHKILLAKSARRKEVLLAKSARRKEVLLAKSARRKEVLLAKSARRKEVLLAKNARRGKRSKLTHYPPGLFEPFDGLLRIMHRVQRYLHRIALGGPCYES